MKCRVELHPLALEELTEILQWYEERSPGLGTRFIDALHERLTEIAAFPDRYPKKEHYFVKFQRESSPISSSTNIFKKRNLFLYPMFFMQNEIQH